MAITAARTVAAPARSPVTWRDTGETGSGMTEDATGPLPVVGDPSRALPSQLARFGELAGRDLSARALAALRARGAYDPQRHGDAGSYQLLTTGEQIEMLALRAAITHDHQPAAPAGPARGGAQRVAQGTQRRAGQHEVLDQELAGEHRQHGEPARRGDPRRGEQEAQRAEEEQHGERAAGDRDPRRDRTERDEQRRDD